MEAINELELRSVLQRRKNSRDLITTLIRRILDPSSSWDDKKVFWHFLFQSGRHATLIEGIIESLKGKHRIPFDLLIAACAENRIKPSRIAIEALLKGLKRQKALTDLLSSKGWDAHDPRFNEIRRQLLNLMIEEQKKLKNDLLEKYEFLRNQRMNEQAGKVLRRLVSIYPDDQELKKLKSVFDEEWAREVLSAHVSDFDEDRFEKTLTAPSSADQEMLKCFSDQSEKICMENRSAAYDLALSFLFMDEHARALDVLAWGQTSASTDWLRVEMLLLARRFIEALELLNHLEMKFSNDPETTFAVSYLRAQCLYASGQQANALEIMQAIVRVRPSYRSAHALILDWTSGVQWE